MLLWRHRWRNAEHTSARTPESDECAAYLLIEQQWDSNVVRLRPIRTHDILQRQDTLGKGKLRSPVGGAIYANVIWPGMKWKYASRPITSFVRTNSYLQLICVFAVFTYVQWWRAVGHTSVDDPQQARRLGNASMGLSIAGIVVTVLVIVISVAVVLSAAADTVSSDSSSSSCNYYKYGTCYSSRTYLGSYGTCYYGVKYGSYCYYYWSRRREQLQQFSLGYTDKLLITSLCDYSRPIQIFQYGIRRMHQLLLFQ